MCCFTSIAKCANHQLPPHPFQQTWRKKNTFNHSICKIVADLNLFFFRFRRFVHSEIGEHQIHFWMIWIAIFDQNALNPINCNLSIKHTCVFTNCSLGIGLNQREKKNSKKKLKNVSKGLHALEIQCTVQKTDSTRIYGRKKNLTFIQINCVCTTQKKNIQNK